MFLCRRRLAGTVVPFCHCADSPVPLPRLERQVSLIDSRTRVHENNANLRMAQCHSLIADGQSSVAVRAQSEQRDEHRGARRPERETPCWSASRKEESDDEGQSLLPPCLLVTRRVLLLAKGGREAVRRRSLWPVVIVATVVNLVFHRHLNSVYALLGVQQHTSTYTGS